QRLVVGGGQGRQGRPGAERDGGQRGQEGVPQGRCMPVVAPYERGGGLAEGGVGGDVPQGGPGGQYGREALTGRAGEPVVVGAGGQRGDARRGAGQGDQVGGEGEIEQEPGERFGGAGRLGQPFDLTDRQHA